MTTPGASSLARILLQDSGIRASCPRRRHEFLFLFLRTQNCILLAGSHKPTALLRYHVAINTVCHSATPLSFFLSFFLFYFILILFFPLFFLIAYLRYSAKFVLRGIKCFILYLGQRLQLSASFFPMGVTEFIALLTSLGITGWSCHKTHFCRDKSFVAINTCFSRQNTSFIATKVCLSRHNFCRDKKIFFATKHLS